MLDDFGGISGCDATWRNRIHDHGPGPDDGIFTDGHTFADKFHLRETILRSIEELPPKYKEIVILNCVEEKSYKEISDILKISISAVGIRLLRARQLLRKKMGKL